MPLDRRMNGSRLSMTRYSQGDRQEAGFVGIPQALSPFSLGPRLCGSPRQMLRTGKDLMIRNGDEGCSDGTDVTYET